MSIRCKHCKLRTTEVRDPLDRALVAHTVTGVLVDFSVQVPVRCQWCAWTIGFRYGESWTSFLHPLRTVEHRCAEDLPPPLAPEVAAKATLIQPTDDILRRFLNPARRGNVDAKVLAYCPIHDNALVQKDMELGGCLSCKHDARREWAFYQERIRQRRAQSLLFTIDVGVAFEKPNGRKTAAPVYLVPLALTCRCGEVELWEYGSVALDHFDKTVSPEAETPPAEGA